MSKDSGTDCKTVTNLQDPVQVPLPSEEQPVDAEIQCLLSYMGLSISNIESQSWNLCEGLAKFNENIERRANLLSSSFFQTQLNFLIQVGVELDILLQFWIVLRTANRTPNFEQSCTNGTCRVNSDAQKTAQTNVYDSSISLSSTFVMQVVSIFAQVAKILLDQFPGDSSTSGVFERYAQPFDASRRQVALENNARDSSALDGVTADAVTKDPIETWLVFQKYASDRANLVQQKFKDLNSMLQRQVLWTLIVQDFGTTIQKVLAKKLPKQCSVSFPTRTFKNASLAKLLAISLRNAPAQASDETLSSGAVLLQNLLQTWNSSGLGSKDTSPTKDESLRLDLQKDFESSPVTDKLNSLLGSSDNALANIRRLEVQEKKSLLQRLGSLITKSDKKKEDQTKKEEQSKNVNDKTKKPTLRERASSVASSIGRGLSSVASSIRSRSPSAESIRSRASSVASSVGKGVSAAASSIGKGLSSAASAVRSRSPSAESIRSNVSSAASSVGKRLSSAASSVGKRLSAAASAVRSRSPSVESIRSQVVENASALKSSLTQTGQNLRRRLSISDETKQNVTEKLQNLSEQFRNYTQNLKAPQWLTKISKKFTKKSSSSSIVKKLQELQTKLETSKKSKASIFELQKFGKDLTEQAPLIRSTEEAELYKTLLDAQTALLAEAEERRVNINPATQVLNEYVSKIQRQLETIESWPSIEEDTIDALVKDLQDFMNAEMGTNYQLEVSDIQSLFDILQSLPDGYTKFRVYKPTKKSTQGQVTVIAYSKSDLLNGSDALKKEGSIWTVPFSISVLTRPVEGASPYKTMIGGSIQSFKFKYAIQIADPTQLQNILEMSTGSKEV